MKRVKVSKKFQIAIPSEVRRQLDIKAGDKLIVDVQGGLITLLPEPEDWELKLRGMLKDVYAGMDIEKHIRWLRTGCEEE